MGFNIGDAISGAVVGFMETGNPYAAGAIGVMDGFTNHNPSASMSADSMMGGGSSSSSLMDYAQLAQASGG